MGKICEVGQKAQISSKYNKVRLRKADVCFHLYVESKNNQINITKQKETNTQNKLVVTSREQGEERGKIGEGD